MRVVWAHQHARNDGVCSVRVNARIPATALRARTGWDTAVVKTLDEVGKADVVVCMSAQDVDEAVRRRRAGHWRAVVAFQSDGPELGNQRTLGDPDAVDQQGDVDAIVCDSEYLRTKIHPRYWAKTSHVPDALEAPPLPPRRHPGRPPVLAWVGATGNYRFAKEVVELLRRRWRVEVVSDGPEAAIPWSLSTVHMALAACDIGIAPYPQDLSCDPGSFVGFRYKDACRAILMQSLGLPVIASSHPAHLQHVSHCEDGLVANRPQDWVRCVEALQDDAALYQRLSAAGSTKALQSLPEAVAAKWESVICYAAR